ncbi:MAG: metal-dependent hydrolase [Nanoarchaeota archaeon]|nr:metal-dependent hydrolase [Nanoarchaeota archaeon]
MKVKYLGHSAFLIGDLLIDPFMTGNPNCREKAKDIKCRVVCVTHDHPDHLGDAFEIAKRNKAVFVAIHELAELAASKGIKSEGMNIGGCITVGGWKIKMVEALHSAGMGHPAGFVLENVKLGKTIYHAGDTGLFSDMKLIRRERIDIAMLPIGDRYTMGIKEAVKAAALLKPKVAVPMHYNTFPVIQANPEDFKKKCAVKVKIFKSGEEQDL